MGRLTACGLIVVATCLPWMSINVSVLGGQSVVASGWDSVTTVGHTDLPNWLIMAAALFVLFYTVLENIPRTRVPGLLPVAFGLYALLQLLTFVVSVAFDKTIGIGSIRIGWWLAFLSTLVMLFTLLRKRRLPIPLRTEP